jgi:hypothetical protein
MSRNYTTQVRKRHIRIYKIFLALRKADGARAANISNTDYYETIAEQEGWDSHTIRKICNNMSKEKLEE